jgi:hypothetical protein
LLLLLRARLATKRAQSNEGAERLRRLEADCEWVVREKANFGKGEYDFEKVDVAEVYRWAVQHFFMSLHPLLCPSC